ncbi:hypothetical protein ZEAMMB73_Zm00001d038286 [Zea mays]|uniref:Ribonuclease H n=1 Tax=Zea mays TaxID=4577 RepID=A0A1D6HED0_MAIZE|nr:hypothetical protein ZEAMMB73_Zm00001d017367 [Zea mays]AQK86226.1 hypothetical protein ZEAMMB73_Zm00001d038286 [Zea mays]
MLGCLVACTASRCCMRSCNTPSPAWLRRNAWSSRFSSAWLAAHASGRARAPKGGSRHAAAFAREAPRVTASFRANLWYMYPSVASQPSFVPSSFSLHFFLSVRAGFVVISVRVLDQKAQMEPMDQRTLLVNQAAAFVAVIYAYFMTMAWYVVHVGRQTGVYSSWEACHAQVNGCKGACYKRYNSREEAMTAFNGHDNEDKQQEVPVLLRNKASAITIKDVIIFAGGVVILVQALIITILVSKLM